MFFNPKFRTLVAFITAICFCCNSYAASNNVVQSLYNYAHSRQLTKIRYMVNNLGYNIDVEDDDGNTAYCIAKEKEDECAMDVLAQFGADTKQRCGLPWGVIGAVAGVAAIGGIAAAAGGGGGGSDSSDPCKSVTCNDNAHCSGGKCICDNGFIDTENDGFCYADLKCSEQIHSTGIQHLNSCECKDNWKGNLCETCNGFEGTDGVCYEKLDCQNGGQQVNGGCDCSTANGYTGILCETCNGLVQDGVCYQELNCNEPHGTQQGTQCICNDTGYDGPNCTDCSSGYGHYGSETECYLTINCVNGTQQGNECKCSTGWAGEKCDVCDTENGYSNINGLCYKDLDCENQAGSTGVQNDNTCECKQGYRGELCDTCDSGYDYYGTTECHATLECVHGTQQGNECICEGLWTGKLCTLCSGSPSEDGGCYETLECGDHGYQQGNTCICESGYGRDGNGQCVLKGSDVVAEGNDISSNYVDVSVSKANYEYANFIGKQYENDGNPLGSIKGNQEDLYLTYWENKDGNVLDMNQNVKLSLYNYSDGDVIGLKSDSTNNIFMSFLSLDYIVSQGGQQNSELYIQNGGSIDNTDGLVTGGNGDVYGIKGGTNTNLYSLAQDFADGIEGQNIERNSNIIIESIGSGDVYGMYGIDGSVNNSLFDVETFTSDKTYTGEHRITDNSKISVSSTGSGNVYSMFSHAGDINNYGIINAASEGGDVYGAYTTSGNVVNAHMIISTSSNGNAYGIYSNTGNISNQETGLISAVSINGNAYGIYLQGSGQINNEGMIMVYSENGNAYGIYATGGATVINSGIISVNDVTCETNCDGSSTNGNFIVLDQTSTYVNRGLTKVASALDFSNTKGTVALGKGGKFEANSIKGLMAIDTSVVTDGFEDIYVEKEAIKSDTLDVDVVSKSAMFNASLKKDEGKDSYSIVMKRKSFAELSPSSSIAEFLEQNYKQHNNSLLFEELKKTDMKSYSKTQAEHLGYSLLPNFAYENMNVFKNLNTILNDELFTSTGIERKMIGYDYLYQSRDTEGVLTGYENYANTMYFMYDIEGDDLIRRGLGMSITQFRSDYDDDSNRKEVMIQGIMPVSYINDHGINFATIARLGYSDGEYERHTSNAKFESDLTSWIYGLSNAARYRLDLGNIILEPSAEFNILGYYQNKIREDKGKTGAIKTDAENNLSVELGIGLNLRKDIIINQNNNLKFNASAMYYHEFAHPYHSLTASMHEMDSTYRITDYENIYDRDRALLSIGMDYSYKQLTLYGKFKAFIEDENPFEVNAGVKYNF